MPNWAALRLGSTPAAHPVLGHHDLRVLRHDGIHRGIYPEAPSFLHLSSNFARSGHAGRFAHVGKSLDRVTFRSKSRAAQYITISDCSSLSSQSSIGVDASLRPVVVLRVDARALVDAALVALRIQPVLDMRQQLVATAVDDVAKISVRVLGLRQLAARRAGSIQRAAELDSASGSDVAAAGAVVAPR
jgi:hypothetical protein